MAVEKYPDENSAIRAMLSEHPEGLTIRSISEMIGMNRNSVAKYLEMLQMQGGLTLKRNGSSKIYCLADKLPAAAVLKLTKSHVIIFNQELTAADVNDSFTDLLKISKKEIIGKSLDLLPFAVQCNPDFLTLIKEGIRGKESKTSASIKTDYRLIACMLTCSPVFFENGSNGVSLIIDLEQEPKNGDVPDTNGDDSLTGLDESEYICRFAPDGTFTYVNPAYCVLLQKTRAELIGHTWRPAIPESEYQKIIKTLHSTNSDYPVAIAEIKVITPLGNSQWQRWKLRILLEENKKSTGYQATGLDITELKKLEQKISKNTEEIDNLLLEHKVEILDLNKQIFKEIASREKAHFKLLFTEFAMDSASYMIMWIGREGRFVYMNREAQKVLGYHYHDVISKKFIDIVAGVFSFPWDEIWETIKKDQHYTLEILLGTSKGDEIPVEMALNYLKFKDKEYCCCFAKDITEKKQAENALRESEEKYRVIFNNEIYAVCIFDFDTLKLLDVNDAYIQMYGYTRDELLSGMTIHDITVEHEASDLVTKKIRKEGSLFIPLRYHKKKDGTIFPVEIVGGPYEWRGKQVMFVLSHNITERLRAEQTIRESEERYRSLFENMLEGFAYCRMLYDEDGRPADFIYLNVNPAFNRIIGTSVVVGKPVTEVFPGIKEAFPELFEIYGRVALTGESESFDLDFTPSRKWIHISVYSLEKGDFVAVFEDITERKQVEDEIVLKNLLLLTQQETSLDGILVVGERGKILSFNRHFIELWDIPEGVIVSGSDELALESVLEKLTDPEEFLAKVNYLNIHKAEKSHEQILFKNGRILDRYSAPMFGEKKKYFGRVWYFRDITERKRAEEALMMANRKLNLFSTITRHDIINQMTVMRGFTARLEKEQPDHSFSEYFQKINASADRISAMIQFTKTYENIGVNTPVWRDVGTFVDAVAKDVSLGQVRFDNEIPAGTEVFADPLIAKVFYNLMDNAVRYGGKITTIRFSFKECDRDYIIVCEDDGDGIVPEEKEKIFERGFGKNTGLGLSLSREILAITGITIRETGEPGKGARFEMTVPKSAWRTAGNSA